MASSSSGRSLTVKRRDHLDENAKKRLCIGVRLAWFFAVVAHTVNLQSEAILIRNACKGDLSKVARVVTRCNAMAGVLGLILNQIGGKLSDSFGRWLFCLLGPITQIIVGATVSSRPENADILVLSKVARGIFTTFSGTMMGTAVMRDAFEGQDLAVRLSKASSIIGVAIMVGPLLESAVLKGVKVGGERWSYITLTIVGLLNLANSIFVLPETLAISDRPQFNFSEALRGANPFRFLEIYRKGSPLLKKLATISVLQTTVDGKNMSDIGQIWMREHLKMSVEGIRNDVMSFGMLTSLGNQKLTPWLLRNMSVWGYTTFTNITNLIAFGLRGLSEKPALYFGVLPLMLPGINGSSNAAVGAVIDEQTLACGFGVGESTAWLNNLRVLLSVIATLLYGLTYGWLKQRGVNPGHTYAVAGLLGAGLPQAMLMLAVSRSDLQLRGGKRQ